VTWPLRGRLTAPSVGMRSSPLRRHSPPLRTSGERLVRRRADACFAPAKAIVCRSSADALGRRPRRASAGNYGARLLPTRKQSRSRGCQVEDV
jgi:hypothetical protein